MRSVALLLTLLPAVCLAFQPLCPRAAFRSATVPLYMSSSPSGKKRKRTRRAPMEDGPKEAVVELQAPPAAPEVPVATPVVPASELKPREETVEFKIQDVRDVLSRNTEEDEDNDDEEEEDDDDDDDDDEWEYVDINEEEDDDEYEYVIEDSSGNKLDSLEQMLADARTFRSAEDKKDEEKEKGGLSIPENILSVLSTIVTVDFFVVLALLAWFFAGIFGQYVLKDETVQIAFNNAFEPIVRPALGILMLGSAAGAAFRKDEEDEFQQ